MPFFALLANWSDSKPGIIFMVYCCESPHHEFTRMDTKSNFVKFVEFVAKIILPIIQGHASRHRCGEKSGAVIS